MIAWIVTLTPAELLAAAIAFAALGVALLCSVGVAFLDDRNSYPPDEKHDD